MTCPRPKSCSCWPALRMSSSAGSVTSSNASRGSTRRWALPPRRRTRPLRQRRAPLRASPRDLRPGAPLTCQINAEPSRARPADSSRRQGRQGEDVKKFNWKSLKFLSILNLFLSYFFITGWYVAVVIFRLVFFNIVIWYPNCTWYVCKKAKSCLHTNEMLSRKTNIVYDILTPNVKTKH